MTNDEQSVRAMFAQWFDEAERQDLDAVVSHIAPDIVSYEHDTPLRYVGVEAVREVCKAGFDATPGHVRWDVPEMTVIVRDDIAVQWGLNRMVSQEPGNAPVEMWSRGTRILQKVGDEWLMIHQHVSFPYDMEDGEARTDLKP